MRGRLIAAAVVVAYVLLGSGCPRTSSTTEVTPPDGDGSVVSESPTTPALQPCPVELASLPKALFDGTAVIRVPVGVDLIERRDGLAEMDHERAPACRSAVQEMLVSRLDNDPAVPLDDYLADFLKGASRQGGAPAERRVRAKDLLVSEVSFPAAESQPEAHGVVVFYRRGAQVYMVHLLTSAEDWPRQEKMFMASAQGMLFRPG